MNKIEEIRENIETLTTELRSALDNKDLETAKSKKEELRQAKELLAIEEEINADEKRELENKVEERKVDDKMEQREISKELEYRALVKTMLGETLNEEEKRAITDGNFNSNTGSIIPQEFINKVEAIRNGYKSLKSYCDVIPVTSDNGKMPTCDLEGELADLEEDTDMIETMLAVPEIDFAVKDYGLLRKVGNNILKDSPVNFIEGILAPAFAVASINKENKRIVETVDTNSTNVTVGASDVVEDKLENVIAKALPSLKAGMVIITNPEGWAYLDQLRADDGHKDDRVTYIGDTLYFKNKEVIAVEDKYLPSLSSGKTMVFYVANLKVIKFFDRQVIEIAKSTEAGFIANKTLVKAIERFDVAANVIAKTKAKKLEA